MRYSILPLFLIFALLVVIIPSYATSSCADAPFATKPLKLATCNKNGCACALDEIPKILNYHIEISDFGTTEIASCQPNGSLMAIFGANDLLKNEFIKNNCPPAMLTEISSLTPPAKSGGDWIADLVEKSVANCHYDRDLGIEKIAAALTQFKKHPNAFPCAPSMCTSAAFFAFIAEAKDLRALNLITEEKFNYWTDFSTSPAWKYINNLARPDLMVKELGLGSGRVINASELNECSQRAWPKRGDFVEFWRYDHSGHSVIYEGPLYNERKQLVGICYWSSNKVTNGYATRCEPINKISKIIIGRIEL